MAIQWWTWCTGGRGCRCWTGTGMTAQGARPPVDGDDGGDGGGTVVSPCRRMCPPTRCSHVPRPQRLPSPPPTCNQMKGCRSKHVIVNICQFVFTNYKSLNTFKSSFRIFLKQNKENSVKNLNFERTSYRENDFTVRMDWDLGHITLRIIVQTQTSKFFSFEFVYWMSRI